MYSGCNRWYFNDKNSAHVVAPTELAAHIASPGFQPKPFRVYCSPFYRCLQTIQPTVEALKAKQQQQQQQQHEESSDIDACADFDVRVENGIGLAPTLPQL